MSEAATLRIPDLSKHRSDFPILEREIDGRTVTYLDSAATSLKPQAVIDAVTGFYTGYTANVHRAVHALSEEATEAFEGARETVARFVNADTREIAFVRNATDAINVVAHTLRGKGCVIHPLSEHHSNLLPWRGGETVALDVLPGGELDLQAALRRIREVRPALLTMSTVSNALGNKLPISELTACAHEVSAYVMLDLSQSVGHEPVDVRALGCDFACFSGHKMLGPSGVGVLYRREGMADAVQPILVGGAMVHEVHVADHTYQPYPWGIEAGTPNIEGVIALGVACDYLENVGVDAIRVHCRHLTDHARAGLEKLKNVKIYGGAGEALSDSIVTFTVNGLAAHGVARMLSNRFAIMVRSGYHCAQPFHEACGIPETVRASVHLYNTVEEIRAFVKAVSIVAQMS